MRRSNLGPILFAEACRLLQRAERVPGGGMMAYLLGGILTNGMKR